MLQWLHTHYNDRFSSAVMDDAACEGRLEVAKWLHEHRSEGCTSLAMDAAANCGHFEMVRWLHDNRSEGCAANVMDYAAEGGYLDIAKWLHESRSVGCSDTAIYYAARDGHGELLRWLVEHYPDNCRESLMEDAVWGGHLDIVRYLDEHTSQRGSRWGLGAAARQGWLQTLRLLMQNYYHDDGEVGWYGLNAVSRAFDDLLAKLSSYHATPTSSLWGEALESLERFHSSGFYSCVSVMLQRALLQGYLTLAQQFIQITSKKWAKVVQWTLENASFNENSRATICNTIKEAPNDIKQWLRENFTNGEARKWLVESH
jgi:hypothetical protein